MRNELPLLWGSHSCRSSRSWALKDRTLVDRYSERFGGEVIQVKGRAFTKALGFLETSVHVGKPWRYEW